MAAVVDFWFPAEGGPAILVGSQNEQKE